MEDFIKSLLINLIENVVVEKELVQNKKTCRDNSEFEITHNVCSDYESTPMCGTIHLTDSEPKSPCFMAADIFSDLNDGELIGPNLSGQLNSFNFTENATQTSQSLLAGLLMDSTAQTSQSLINLNGLTNSTFDEPDDQLVPSSVIQLKIKPQPKIRRIGLSRKSRIHSQHLNNK